MDWKGHGWMMRLVEEFKRALLQPLIQTFAAWFKNITFDIDIEINEKL